MPLDLFSPSMAPSADGTRRSVGRRINQAMFGDGYGQRSQDGLNAPRRTFTAVWSLIDSAEADTYEAFFDAHSVAPFLWTPPLETAQRKWIAGDSDKGYKGAEIATLSCVFTEVFDL